jgi:tetratricopeptide (TPR) repeat protein
MQRSRALNLMGEVAFDRGNLKEAGQLYEQAMAGTAEAVRRSPDDPQRIFDHAQNVFYVGEVARFAGRPAEAEAAWRDYKRLADRMSALAPDSLKYRMEVLYAEEDLGISLYYQHRFAEARRLLDGAAGPMEKLASLYPADATYQKEFATELAWIADTQRSEGNFGGAIGTRKRQISTLEQQLEKAEDSDVRSRLISGHEGLGVVLAEDGQPDRAIDELQSSIGEAERLIPLEPRNAQWKSIAADARLQLALTLLSVGRPDDAAQETESGCTLAASLPAVSATARTRLGTTCAMMRCRLALGAGNTQQAATFAERALQSGRAEHSEDPISDRYRVAHAYRLLGDVRQRGGDSAAALVAWNAGVAQLPTGVTERPSEMNERAQLLMRLGRTRDAAPLTARLESIGYRRFS